MRKMATRFMAITMAGIMTVSIAGCGSSKKNNTSEAEATTQTSAKTVTEEDVLEQTGVDLTAPEGASNVSYQIVDNDGNLIAEMDFTKDGNEMYVRACSTTLTSLNDLDADSDSSEVLNVDFSTGDISGLTDEWISGGTNSISDDLESVFNIGKNGSGYIAWIDAEPGILYNVCMTENADADTLTETAKSIASLVTTYQDGEDYGSQLADYYAQILEDVYATKAGSAGSSSRVEAAASELRTFVSDYAEDISLQSMEALAAEDLTNMQEKYSDDTEFVNNFSEEFNEVVETVLSQDKDLETDVAFNQVVNATTNQLDSMK